MSEDISMEEEWEKLAEGIVKATKCLQGDMQMGISSEEYIKYYTCAFMITTQSYNNCEVVYDRYKLTLNQCVTSMVLPSLMGKKNVFLLHELVRMWSNYQKMTKVTSGFLAHLDRYYIHLYSRPPLKTVAASCFFDLVFPTQQRYMINSVRDAVVSLINQEREGQEISHDLINSFMAFIADGNTVFPDLYESEIETVLCEGAYIYYSQKGFSWFLSGTCNYVSKYEECLIIESERADRYLIFSRDYRKQYFVQVVNTALVNAYEKAIKAKMINFGLQSVCSCRCLALAATMTTIDEKLSDLDLDDGNTDAA